MFSNLDSRDEYEKLAEIFKMVGCVTRLKILIKLSEGECSATEIALAVELSQSAASHQLKDMKNCRLIKSRKDGQKVYYSLDDHHILDLLKTGLDHVRGEHCHV